MDSQMNRSLIAAAFAGLAAACGGWAVLVRPSEASMARAISQRDGTQQELARLDPVRGLDATVKRLERSKSAIAARADEQAAASRDPGRLYDVYGKLAAKAGVRIERMDPTRVAPTSAAKAMSGAETFGFSIDARGDYNNITLFLKELEELGFTKVTGLRVGPVDHLNRQERDEIQAIIDTMHLKVPTRAEYERSNGKGPQT
jgi:hypothetical protein